MTRRRGFICDDCGEEKRRIGPAAVVKDIDGKWLELCEPCYDDYVEVRA